MLRVVHAVLKNATPCHDRTADCEAPMAKRNASRWIRMLEKYDQLPAAGDAGARPV